MKNRYLLYIDVLGFRDMCHDFPGRVNDLFQIVASLSVHHHGEFAVVAFSDTILVHELPVIEKNYDHGYVVMYQCEFFQDLLHRTAGRGLSFRAVLTYGPFEHYRLNDMPFFYGDSLIRAYDADKSLQITGLVMDDHCKKHSRIFSTRPIAEDWHYVFVTQGLDEWEDQYEGMVPLPKEIVNDTDLGWNLGPELETLAWSAHQAAEHEDPRVREKHSVTLAQYRLRYPRVCAAMEPHGFAMERVSTEFDWVKVRERMEESYSWGSVRTPPRAGE